MTYITNPRHYTVPEFQALVEGLKWDKGWRPAFPTLHNTGGPNLKEWIAYGPTVEERWAVSLEHYYKGLGWHCFGGDVKFCTSEGVKTFAECAGETVKVLTPNGYVEAPIKKFGRQPLSLVKLVQVTPRVSGGRTWYSPSASAPIELRVTQDHTWPLANGGLTRELKVGHIVADGRYCPDEESLDFSEGMRHGFIYGDGWAERGKFLAGVHGRKIEILDYFQNSEIRFFPSRAAREPTYACTLMVSSDRDLKSLPDITDSLDYLAGFVRGWTVADGSIKRGSTYKLSSSKYEPLKWLVDIAPYVGISVSASNHIVENSHGDMAYKQGIYYTLDIRFSDRPWRVESIEQVGIDNVYCAILPNEEKLFTLANGILTHNSGPHLVCCPDYIWILCDLEQDGVSVSCWNHLTIGIEMVGDYSDGADDPNSGDGARVIANGVSATAILANKLKWDLTKDVMGVSGLHFHRECLHDHHACPGNRVNKTAINQRILSAMTVLAGQTSPVPIVPLPVAPVGPEPAVLGTAPSGSDPYAWTLWAQTFVNTYGSSEKVVVDGAWGEKTRNALSAMLNLDMMKR